MVLVLSFSKSKMENGGARKKIAAAAIVGVLLFLRFRGLEAIRFEIDKDECLAHKVEFAKDTVRVSFVVIKVDSPGHSAGASVDLLVKGPSDEHILYYRRQTDGKFEFIAGTKGLYKFCFWNKSPYKETVYFNAYDDHYLAHGHADEAVNKISLKKEIDNLEQALNDVELLQRWLKAHTEHTKIVTEEMSRRAIYKAIVDSAGLIGSSLLQIFLLRLLFDRKIRAYRF